MGWYHVNKSDCLERIVQTTSTVDGCVLKPYVPKWLLDLPSDAEYTEPLSPKRVPVAPTVWQCISALGRADGNPKGDFTIYFLETAYAIAAKIDSKIETSRSCEHWITDETLDMDGGVLNLLKVGWVRVEEVFEKLKYNFVPEKVLQIMKKEEEPGRIWNKVDVDQVPRWCLNEAGLKEIRDEALF